jgi:alkanesulfonate monooxygenase SsuD/methylene tetrahydromethanopterin reductase-like flavin-dependent oxidoreductase (luciferase family)
MALFGIRFDLRNPEFAGVSTTERYQAALDMAQWADGHGFLTVVLSEHHGSADGYLPSPLPMAAAIAGRTKQIRINIAALVASFHDPLRLAEDIAVVDQISGGRLDVVLTNGYVASEFAMFDRDLDDRPRRTVAAVEALRAAWTGEPFEFDGRTVHVTPAPCQPGGPKITMGGSSEVAARRAARHGDGYMPSTPPLWEHYRDECVRIGKPDPGPYIGADTSVVHVAQDVERGWADFAPHALHEMNAYGEWMADAGVAGVGGYEPISDLDALRETGQYRVLTPAQLTEEIRAKGPYGFTLLHPMVGGLPPDVAWESLRLIEAEVFPAVT